MDRERKPVVGAGEPLSLTSMLKKSKMFVKAFLIIGSTVAWSSTLWPALLIR